MATYTPNEALESLDLEWVLGNEGVEYKQSWGSSGRQLNLRCCPFCGNNKYKVYVNADTGLGNCFAGSCHQGTFNKWQLLKGVFEIEGRSLHTKIEDLARHQGWRPAAKAVSKFDPGPLDLPPNERIVDLPAMPRYLLDRDMDYDLAAHFDLRWCEKGDFKVQDPDGKTIIQDYSKRVIIPIYDMEGNLISFQGRDATDKSDKRYLFPPMYSSTGSHLYNINNWVDTMDTVLICEGPFDVIGARRGLTKFGMTKVLPIGSFGMTFSVNESGEDQLNKLLLLKRRGLKNVIFMWDNEDVAIKRAIAAGLRLQRHGFNTHVAVLHDCKDPGEATPAQIGAALASKHPIKNALQAMLLERQLTQ